MHAVEQPFEANQESDRRYEIKLPLANRTPAAIEYAIHSHPAGFETLYPDRWIQNVYFDTIDYKCFQVSNAGADQRVKLRLRWYQDSEQASDSEDPSSGQLEWKHRRGALGWKWTEFVDWEEGLSKIGWSSARSRMRASIGGRQRRVFDALPVPTLFNRYLRSYYISRDGRCRLTHDRKLGFAPQIGGLNVRTRFPTLALGIDVLEIKVVQRDFEVAREILNELPYRPARFSKYCTGIESLIRGSC